MDRLVFPVALGSAEVERWLLRRVHDVCAESRAGQRRVIIDLNRLAWIDLLPLGFLALTLHELSTTGMMLELVFPDTASREHQPDASGLREVPTRYFLSRQKVCSFLERWGFLRILSEDRSLQEVYHNWREVSYTRWSKSADNPISDVKELTSCLSRNQVRSIEREFDYEHSLAQAFERYSALSIVESRDLSKVIIRELGDNVVDHAAWQLAPTRATGLRAYVALRLVKPLSELEGDRERLHEIRITRACAPERAYLSRGAAREGYLEVIVIDNGAGIVGTLRDEYEKQEGGAPGRDSDVLAWALAEWSTRDRALRRSADTSTGLFWVAERVINKRGFMRIRSGGADVCLLGSQNGGEGLMKRDNLVSFPGTQVQIIFPIAGDSVQRSRSMPLYRTQPRAVGPTEDTARVLNLGAVRLGREALLPKGHAAVTALEGEVDRAATQVQRGSASHLVLDLKGPDWTRAELDIALKPIRVKSISIGRPVVLVNVSPGALSVLHATAFRAFCLNECFVVPALLEDGSAEWLGARDVPVSRALIALIENQELDLTDLRSELGPGPWIDELLRVVRLSPHVLTYDSARGVIRCLVSRRSIDALQPEVMKEWWVARIRSIALLDGKFFFKESGYYAAQFIEASRLLATPDTRMEIRLGLSEWVMSHGVECILTCTSTGVAVAGIAADVRETPYTYYPTRQFMPGDAPYSAIREHRRYGVVTDVIGTGSTVVSLIRAVRLREAEAVGVFALVDTNETALSCIDGVRVTSLAHFPTHKWTALPDQWDDARVDRIDASGPRHALVGESSAKPLLRVDDPQGFWEVARQVEAVCDGHWVYGELHYQNYVAANRLLAAPEYSRRVFQTLAQRAAEPIDLLLVPQHRETSVVEEVLRSAFQDARFEWATKHEAVGGSGFRVSTTCAPRSMGGMGDFEGRHVLIFDTGTITGGTLRSLRDIARLYGARRVTMLVLLQRIDDQDLPFILDVPGFPPITLYYLQRLYSRPSGARDCQICHRRKLVQDIIGAVKSPVGKQAALFLDSIYQERSAQSLEDSRIPTQSRFFIRGADLVIPEGHRVDLTTWLVDRSLERLRLREHLYAFGLRQFVRERVRTVPDKLALVAVTVLQDQPTYALRKLPEEEAACVVETCRTLLFDYPPRDPMSKVALCDVWARTSPTEFLGGLPKIAQLAEADEQLYGALLLAIWTIAREDKVYHTAILESLERAASESWARAQENQTDAAKRVRGGTGNLRGDISSVVPEAAEPPTADTVRAIYWEIAATWSPDHLPVPRILSDLSLRLHSTPVKGAHDSIPSDTLSGVRDLLGQLVPGGDLASRVRTLQENAARLCGLEVSRATRYFTDHRSRNSFARDVKTLMHQAVRLTRLDQSGMLGGVVGDDSASHAKSLRQLRGSVDRLIRNVTGPEALLRRSILGYYTELSGALQQQLQGFSDAFSLQDIDLEFSVPPGKEVIAQVDSLRFHMVILHMVKNALEHIPSAGPGERRYARFALATGAAGTVELHYSDNGPKPVATRQDDLFKPGHGLYLARRDVSQVGGNLFPVPDANGFALRLEFRSG